jgi:hypothetical protein
MGLIAKQQYVQNQTGGAITEPVNSSWIAAYAIYLGQTVPVNGSWLQALCIGLGITQPQNGSWLIALCAYYGITEPQNGNTWWQALANAGGTPPVGLIWNTTNTNWEAENSLWNG